LSLEHVLELELSKIPVMVVGDPARIEQVLFNLITNSIRYSPKKTKVRIFVDIGEKSARVCVVDHGVGLGKEDLSKIFHRFSRGSNVGNVGGMGIGLYISSELIRAHGGRIWAESPGQNQGSKFCFELPMLGPEPVGDS